MDQILSPEYMKLLWRLQDHFTVHGNVELQGQILKIQEELGEVAEAYIGATGANPRKGITHTLDDVAMELADVVITALLAIVMCRKDPGQVMAAQAIKTIQRIDDFDKERDLNGR